MVEIQANFPNFYIHEHIILHKSIYSNWHTQGYMTSWCKKVFTETYSLNFSSQIRAVENVCNLVANEFWTLLSVLWRVKIWPYEGSNCSHSGAWLGSSSQTWWLLRGSTSPISSWNSSYTTQVVRGNPKIQNKLSGGHTCAIWAAFLPDPRMPLGPRPHPRWRRRPPSQPAQSQQQTICRWAQGAAPPPYRFWSSQHATLRAPLKPPCASQMDETWNLRWDPSIPIYAPCLLRWTLNIMSNT